MAYNIELLAGTSGTRVTPSNKLVDNADERLDDARAPLAHAGTHASGGSDPVTPAAIGAATAAQGALADSAVQPAGTPVASQLAYWTTAQILAGANLVSCDATNSRIGIGTLAPLGALHVVGNGLTAHDLPGFVATDDSRSKTLGVQGDTFAYLVGYTADKSFACGISTLGKAFAGSVTAHDFDLRRGDVAKIILTAAGATLPAETASRVVCLDAGKTLKSSSVTTTELESLTGIEDNVQGQLDARAGFVIDSGAGTSADPWMITLTGGAAKLSVQGYYKFSVEPENESIDIQGGPNVYLDPGSTWGVRGVLEATTTMLAAATTLDTDITVSDGSGFAVGDYVVIKASDHDVWVDVGVSKVAPAELNRITAITGNTLTLERSPARAYGYNSAWAAQASVTKVTPISLALRDINILQKIECCYAKSVYIENVHSVDYFYMDPATASNNVVIRNSSFTVDVDNVDIPIWLSGVTNGLVENVTCLRGENSLRLYGCAGVRVSNCTFKDFQGRCAWVWASRKCTLSDITEESYATQTANMEINLADYSDEITFERVFTDTPKMTGLVSTYENRYCQGPLFIRDVTAHVYSPYFLTHKATAKGTLVDGAQIFCHTAGANAYVCAFNSGIYAPTPVTEQFVRLLNVRALRVGTCTGIRMVYHFAGGGTTGNGISDPYALIEIDGCFVDRGTGRIAELPIRTSGHLAFTSGGTTEIAVGDTVTGATSGATAYVQLVRLESGSWAGGDAAGTLIVTPVVPGDFPTAFVVENLNVGTSLDVATVAGDVVLTKVENYKVSNTISINGSSGTNHPIELYGPARNVILDGVHEVDCVNGRGIVCSSTQIENIYIRGTSLQLLNVTAWSQVRQMDACSFTQYVVGGTTVSSAYAGWVNLTPYLAAGFSAFSGVQVPLAVNRGVDSVYVTAMITKSSNLAVSDVIMTLPEQMRPKYKTNLQGISTNLSTGAGITLSVNTDGEVYVAQCGSSITSFLIQGAFPIGI